MAGHAGGPPSYFYPFHKTQKGKSKEDFPVVEGKEGEHLTNRLTDEALTFIEANKDKPFHLTLAFYAVHTPIRSSKHLVKKYEEKIKKLGIKDGGPTSTKDVVKNSTGVHKTVQNNPSYAGMIEKLDNNVGRILNRLEKLGIADDTVVVLTSDHGGLSSRGHESKRELATTNFHTAMAKAGFTKEEIEFLFSLNGQQSETFNNSTKNHRYRPLPYFSGNRRHKTSTRRS